MPTVWRLNIKTAASHGIDPRRFCIDRQILGVGWPVDYEGEVDWDTYYKLAEELYYNQGYNGWWPALNAIKNRMQLDDLCWTRDWDGVYYLGRIVSDWIYRADQAHRDADVINFRSCVWKKVGQVDAVPGKVLNSFIPPRTLQAVDDESVRLYSQFLYNSLQGNQYYELPVVPLDIFSLISAEDCEDLVGIFLQEKGYLIVPSSCRADTAAYEFVLKHNTSGNTAVAQVKQGCEDLVIAKYTALPSKVYLFTTHGSYIGEEVDNVQCISPDELRNFAFAKRNMMSDRIKTWIAIIEALKGKEV